MARTLPTSKKSGITPLWIVAAFVSLAEVTLGVALTQVQGGVQISLTVFVITFPVLVAAAFFGILWSRPWVFYAPSEYGNVDPKHFMSAMRDTAPLVTEQVELAKSIEANPDDSDARFSLIDAMADAAQCQWIIFMHETGKDIPRNADHIYEYKEGSAGTGMFEGYGRSKLTGTGLVVQAGGGRYLSLTEQGHEFAKWLLRKGRKCDFFWSPLGEWGVPTPGGAAEKWMKEKKNDALALASVDAGAGASP